MTANTAWVEISTTNGSTYKGKRARVPWDRLAGEIAPGDEEIREKFLWIGKQVGVVSEPVLTKVATLCFEMELLPDVSVLESLMYRQDESQQHAGSKVKEGVLSSAPGRS